MLRLYAGNLSHHTRSKVRRGGRTLVSGLNGFNYALLFLILQLTIALQSNAAQDINDMEKDFNFNDLQVNFKNYTQFMLILSKKRINKLRSFSD